MSSVTYLSESGTLPYCKGCGHGLVLHALDDALSRLALPPSEVVVVTDIGCVGLADAQFSTPHTVHTTHGRSTAFATGISIAANALEQRRLKTLVMIGDGGAMLGLNHLIHAALLNADVTVLVHNNFLFGMTGGQNSVFSPVDFVTSTTRHGNTTPPLDLARLLMAARASFVARKIAGDRDLPDVIAQAIAHPGFAVVEILELCTAYATRWNAITGATLKAVAADAGYELGILQQQERTTFSKVSRRPTRKPAAATAKAAEPVGGFSAALREPLSIVLAGAAGEHVQSAATLLARAAILCGLEATQKNDNPVTQGTGFSVSEVILSPREIVYTGIDSPDVVLITSADGATELYRSGLLHRLTGHSEVLADAAIELPKVTSTVKRFAFRGLAGAKYAALAAVAQWVAMSKTLPLDSLWQAIDDGLHDRAAGTRMKLEMFLQTP